VWFPCVFLMKVSVCSSVELLVAWHWEAHDWMWNWPPFICGDYN
jgi:hypothetical protein